MRNYRKISFVAVVAALAALLVAGFEKPAHADLTGPKPPPVVSVGR